MKAMLAQLVLLTSFLSILLSLAQYYGFLEGLVGITWAGLFFFFIISLVIVFMASQVKASMESKTINSLFLGALFFKFMMCVLLIFGYVVLFKPDSVKFVFPLALFYLIYSFIDVSYLVRISRTIGNDQKTT